MLDILDTPDLINPNPLNQCLINYSDETNSRFISDYISQSILMYTGNIEKKWINLNFHFQRDNVHRSDDSLIVLCLSHGIIIFQTYNQHTGSFSNFSRRRLTTQETKKSSSRDFIRSQVVCSCDRTIVTTNMKKRKN